MRKLFTGLCAVLGFASLTGAAFADGPDSYVLSPARTASADYSYAAPAPVAAPTKYEYVPPTAAVAAETREALAPPALHAFEAPSAVGGVSIPAQPCSRAAVVQPVQPCATVAVDFSALLQLGNVDGANVIGTGTMVVPQEVRVIVVEKRVEVPVDRVVVKRVPVPVYMPAPVPAPVASAPPLVELSNIQPYHGAPVQPVAPPPAVVAPAAPAVVTPPAPKTGDFDGMKMVITVNGAQREERCPLNHQVRHHNRSCQDPQGGGEDPTPEPPAPEPCCTDEPEPGPAL